MFTNRFFSLSIVFILLVTLLSVASACGKDPETTGPIFQPNNFAGDVEDTPPDVPPPTPDVEPDVGPAGPPGFMHGEWEMRKNDAEEEHLYSLQLVHIEGDSRVTGNYTYLEGGTSGILSPGTWNDEFSVLAIDWVALVQGGERTFSIVGAEKQTDDLLQGRFNDRFTLSTYDVKLIRKP